MSARAELTALPVRQFLNQYNQNAMLLDTGLVFCVSVYWIGVFSRLKIPELFP